MSMFPMPYPVDSCIFIHVFNARTHTFMSQEMNGRKNKGVKVEWTVVRTMG